MLPKLSGGLRAALVLALSFGYVAWHTHDAFAKKGGDDSGDDDGDDGGDDDGGGAGNDSGGDDDDNGDDKDQPAMTAGGLYTMGSYPVSEIMRPLSMTQHITQLRLGIGTDLSAKGAFGSAGLSLEGTYGLSDNFNLIGGFTNAYNMKQFGLYFGFEGALYYDIVDIRLAADVHRNAIPEFQNFCTPLSSVDPINPQDPAQCGTAKGGPPTPMAELVNLPDGTYHAGGTKFSLDLGFPFRYSFTPQIAIVALQTLMTIDFNSVDRDHIISNTVINTDPNTGMMTTTTVNTPVGNKVTPDLNPSLGIATNPIPPLSVVIFAQLRIPDFDTSAGQFVIPVTGRVEFSPSQKFDIGLEFILLNVKPPDPQSPIDNRYLSVFMQARY